MASIDDLEPVVSSFRTAEESLRSLTDQIDTLQTASGALADAKTGITTATGALKDSAVQLADLSVQLGNLASQLAGATEALIKADPEGVKRELKNNVEQVERLRSRIDETAGQSKAATEAVGRMVSQTRVIASVAAALALAATLLMFVVR